MWILIFTVVHLHIINIKTTIMEQEFTVLENKIVGRNIYISRKIKDKKAIEVADYLGISESAYTKYERGESKITIDIVQRIAELFKIDPFSLLSAPSGHFIESGTNEHGAVGFNNYVNTIDEKHTALLTKLIEMQIAMTEKIMALLEKKWSRIIKLFMFHKIDLKWDILYYCDWGRHLDWENGETYYGNLIRIWFQ